MKKNEKNLAFATGNYYINYETVYCTGIISTGSGDYHIETLRLVKGSVIQSKNIGKDIMAGFKTIVGGELKGYSEMINEARAKATKRMVEEAEKLSDTLHLLSCRVRPKYLCTELP